MYGLNDRKINLFHIIKIYIIELCIVMYIKCTFNNLNNNNDNNNYNNNVM